MNTRDVEDGKGRINLPGLLRDFPAVYSAQQLDIGYKRAVFASTSLEQGDRFFAGRRDSRFKTAIRKSVFNDDLNRRVVFDNQDQ
ncbi:MAG: hypothetical protein QOJ15_3396 [Bradyrhizobium sp.]|nr:hypothetical protein [Bradyrhizobium sp.]